MSRYEWLLFFHVAGAFITVAGLVLLTVAVIAAHRRERPSEVALVLGLARPNGGLFAVGGFLLLIFGLWMVFDLDGYDITDGWILAGLALWLLASFAGTRADQAYARIRKQAAQIAVEGDAPSSELSASLRDPPCPRAARAHPRRDPRGGVRHDLQAGSLTPCSPPSGQTTSTGRSSSTSWARCCSSARFSRP